MENLAIVPDALSEFNDFTKPEISDYSDLELYEIFVKKCDRSTEKMAKFFGCTKSSIETLKIQFRKIQLDLREKFLEKNSDNSAILALVEVEIDTQRQLEKLHQTVFETLQKRVEKLQSDLFDSTSEQTDELIKILNATKDYAKNSRITEETIQRTSTRDGVGIDSFQRRIQEATSL